MGVRRSCSRAPADSCAALAASAILSTCAAAAACLAGCHRFLQAHGDLNHHAIGVLWLMMAEHSAQLRVLSDGDYLICLRQEQDAGIQGVPADARCKVRGREAICCRGSEPGGGAALACLQQPLRHALIRRNGRQVQGRQPCDVLQVSLQDATKASAEAVLPLVKHLSLLNRSIQEVPDLQAMSKAESTCHW